MHRRLDRPSHRTSKMLSTATALIAMVSGGLAAIPSAKAQTYNVIARFGGSASPYGAVPYSGLIMNSATGNLYGTTTSGGSGTGGGTAYVLYPNGNGTVLRRFEGWNGEDPVAPLVQDALGNFYGTTYKGGSRNGEEGEGTVFKLGEGSPLHVFTGSPDGANPWAGLIVDSSGNLYGTTVNGGAGNAGTVFEIDAEGVESIVYSFTGGTDGASPYGGLVMDSAGNLYGTTNGGGGHFEGAVFKLDTSGNESVLYSFAGAPDGQQPMGGLVMDSAGNFYGTTEYGGDASCYTLGCGTVFELDSAGNETILHAFRGSPDGRQPFAGLVIDSAGNLYGTTPYGGTMTRCINYDNDAVGCGTVFEIDNTGAETILHSMGGGGLEGGSAPYGGLLIDSAGTLYGTAAYGGNGPNVGGDGLVFEITP
jgi:uncharacterized repeat protein (TIGR03803 family)